MRYYILQQNGEELQGTCNSIENVENFLNVLGDRVIGYALYEK
jgi:hypothetical protein